jgi:hypothetical protein
MLLKEVAKMFLKVIFTIVASGLAVFIALKSKATVDVQILSKEISIPVAVMVCCLLILGVGIGVVWRRSRKSNHAKVRNQVPIIADLKVCK